MQLAPQAAHGCHAHHVLMAYTKDDLITIERAIASGSRRVRFADQEVEYRSLAELLKARDEIKAALNPAAAMGDGLFGGRRFMLHQRSKGL